jgi:hypothetical protein
VVNPATLEQARAAKRDLSETLGGHPALAGIGIARWGDGFALKVNLRERPRDLDIPARVQGVAVRVEVVGRIVAR